MRHSLLLIFLFVFKVSFAQYKVGTTIRSEYWKVFDRLPEEIKQKKAEFPKGLGLLSSVKTDTLNKNEHEPMDTSVKVYSINEETGEQEPIVVSREEETISAANPQWLDCGCRFEGDTLRIGAGFSLFSGFAVITNLFRDKAKAIYSEHESEGKVFRTKLSNKKVSEFVIPATIKDLTIDRKPQKGMTEIYGKMSVITNGYYSYINVWGFKHDYIYKRMRYEFYFQCNITKQRIGSK